MKTGTTIGLLVGGAVLLLAAAPRGAFAAGGQTLPAQPAPGGMLNPFNWFSGRFPSQAQPSMLQQGQGANPYGYSPALNSILSGSAFMPGGGVPAPGPAGGFQPGAYSSGNYGIAGGGYQQAAYDTGAYTGDGNGSFYGAGSGYSGAYDGAAGSLQAAAYDPDQQDFYIGSPNFQSGNYGASAYNGGGQWV